MGKSRSKDPTVPGDTGHGKAFTPPKGRPTRARNDPYYRKQVFGPTAQWIALTIFLILVFVVLFILTDGGDFNPFNEDDPFGGDPYRLVAARCAADHGRGATLLVELDVGHQHAGAVVERGVGLALPQGEQGRVERLVRASPQAAAELGAPVAPPMRAAERRDP